MPGISHEGKKGRCCCCRRCDPPDGRKNGKGGGPLRKATRVGEPGEMLHRTASSRKCCFHSEEGREGWEEGKAAI